MTTMASSAARIVRIMRDVFHDELDEIGAGVAEMIRLVAAAMEQATGALLDANLVSAEQVIAADVRVDALREDLEDRAFQMIARQQPVATDLRILITTLHLVADLERMGDLALHVAKIARLRFPELAVPAEARDVIAQMGAVARSLVHKVGDVVEGRDIELAQAIEAEDDSMDALRRKLFTLVLSPRWAHGTEAAIDMTLLGRYYERYADHAVAVARRTIFIVTGQRPGPMTNGMSTLR
ncbi:MAG: phosphate transport system protein [Pseudonocardiales bacterium]|nr:phosphate transport system protein [Pseudonocardiales bacterium]